MRACAAWRENHMRDSSDVTGAAVQVRLEGSLFAELENWRRAQPKIVSRSWALSNCSSERWPTIDAPARSMMVVVRILERKPTTEAAKMSEDWKRLAANAWQAPSWREVAEKLSRDEIRRRIGLAPADNQHSEPFTWPTPKPLPNGLAPVAPFSLEFLPDRLAPWIADISNRLQCPPDYAAVAAMVALGAVIGRRLAIKPQQKTDWTEIPNIWGGFIGRPGMLKSPAMGEALKPIHHLEAEAAKDNELARQAYEAGLQMFKLKQDVAKALTKSKLKKDGDAKIEIDLSDEPKEPLPVRYRTNDTTYEGLGELLIANPSGMLVERDELVSLLQFLDREDQAVARGFYLSGWSGTQPYTFDRIGRGQRHIEAVCVSVLGNTQPARMVEYVRKANAGGAGGDGMIQRFGLLVWPDAPRDWRNVDEYPDSAARAAAWDVFDRAAKITMNQALAMGATMGRFDKRPIPPLRRGGTR